MILRDIFLTLETVLDLHYEKNANGTYRVNTIIRELVYPGLYKDCSYQDNEIGYYLSNIELSYQGEANIRNAFTELMRPKENSNRYPTACFCDSIDIDKMYDYYRTLIESACRQNPDRQKDILNFIEATLNEDEELKAKLQLICHSPYHFLTWIVIFSMFNSQLAYGKYEAYLKINSSEYSSFHLTDTTTRHAISKHLQKQRRQLSYITTSLVVANSLQLVYLVVPFILSNNTIASPLSSSSACIILLSISTILLAARFIHMKIAKQYSCLQTYYDNFDLKPEISDLLKNTRNYKTLHITPYQITTHSHVEREQFRIKIRIATGIGLLLSLLISILAKSLPLMIAGACLICFLGIYFDQDFNSKFHRSHYDALTLSDGETPNPSRGMAKIYRCEYEITKFDADHEYYYSTSHVHSATCFKHIFSMTYNRIYNYIIVSTVVLMCFNVIILCIAILYQLVPEIYIYLRVPSETFFASFVVLLLIALSIINIISLSGTTSDYISLAQIAFASSYAGQDMNHTERTFLHLQAQGKIKDVDVARGIFSHSMEYMDKKLPFETIWPESDRMLFIHRVPTLRPFITSLIWLLFGAFFSIFVWHCKMYTWAIPLLVITVSLILIIDRFFLDKIGRKKCISEIKALD